MMPYHEELMRLLSHTKSLCERRQVLVMICSPTMVHPPTWRDGTIVICHLFHTLDESINAFSILRECVPTVALTCHVHIVDGSALYLMEI